MMRRFGSSAVRHLAVAGCLLLFGGGLVGAQDLTTRRGFKVEITEPQSGQALLGPTTIRAEVTVRSPEEVLAVDFFLDDKLLFSDGEPPYQFVHDFGKQASAHVIRAVARHRQGLTVSAFVVSQALDFAAVVDVQRVLLNVAVRDASGRFVPELVDTDFRVSENGAAQEILSVSHEERPIVIGILIDSSGSMIERMATARAAACRFAETLESEDRGFVIDFDELVTLRQPATADHALLCAAIKDTRAVGGTALYDAVHGAFRVLHQLPLERFALVILSDGEDTESSATLDAILEEARRSEVTIYGIGLGTSPGLGQNPLSRLADETGGRAIYVSTVEELAGTYEAIAAELRGLYQIVYRSSGGAPDGKFRRIRVSLTRDGRFELRHRAGYYASVE